jgi:hypothetical protein
MVKRTCPHCNAVYLTDAHNTDFIHDCNSGVEALDNEDIVMPGTYTDSNGVTYSLSTKEVMIKSVVDKSYGQGAVDDKRKTYDYTTRGNRKTTHITRKHQEYIDHGTNN